MTLGISLALTLGAGLYVDSGPTVLKRRFEAAWGKTEIFVANATPWDLTHVRAWQHAEGWSIRFAQNHQSPYGLRLEKTSRCPYGDMRQHRRKMSSPWSDVPQARARHVSRYTDLGTCRKSLRAAYWLTQGTPGKLGNDENQSEVRADISKADADLVCMSFNATVARWLTEWNFPGAALPQVWRIMDEEEDLNIRAERDVKLSGIGYKPSLKYIQDTYGGEWEAAAPRAAPDLTGLTNLSGLQSAAPPAEFADPAPEPDTPETMAARLAADTANAMADLIADIGKRVAAAETIEGLQRDLVNAYGHLDTEELTRIMALGFAAAELAGMVEAAE